MNNDISARVSRGGSWYGDARYAGVAYRNRKIPSGRSGDLLGFRLSRIISPLEQLSEVLNEKG